MSTKRQFFFVMILLAYSVTVKAQMNYLYAHSNFQAIRSATFEKFAAEYNNFYSADLSQKIDPVRMGSGWGIGVMHSSEAGLKIGFEYNWVRSKTSATFSDGAVRDFKLKDGGFSLCFGYSPATSLRSFYFYPVVGVSIGKSKLITTYSPGSNNFSGTFLDGNYQSIALKYYLGINTAFGSDNLKLLLKVHYVGKALHEDLVDEDKNINVVENGKVGANYASFVTDRYTYSGQYLENDFSGFRFSVGVSFDFD